MTREEYKAAMRVIRSAESELRNKELLLYNEYRSEHRKFDAGDKVRIKEKMGIKGDVFHDAYVLGCGVHDSGELYYQFAKSKKDGSMSSHRLYLSDYNIEEIELIEKAKTTH
jgi:hypothetical protein